MEIHKKWIEQCEASVGIKERYGTQKALGYLIGEKLLNHLQASEKDSLFEQELIPFCMMIKNLFEQWEIRQYLAGIKKRGARGHVLIDELNSLVGDAVNQNLVDVKKNTLRLEKIKTLLLENN